MGVTDLLPMVPVRWLGIAYLHGVDSVCFYRFYVPITILLSLQKLLCCASIVLGVSFLLC
jgi:hypothetical protein